MKRDFSFRLPLANAAGFLGFAPGARAALPQERMGAFFTNPISLEPRTPASGERLLHFPGGFLLHTGHPNPGLSWVLRQTAARWKRSPVPVFVHLLAKEPGEVEGIARRLEEVEGAAGIELGLPPDAGEDLAFRLVSAAAQSELPVIARLPLDHWSQLAEAAARGGAAGMSLGAPRGSLPCPSGELISGRLYGPALFPLALAAVRTLASLGLPVIGAGGIYMQGQVDAMISAGAVAVQLDAVLWRGGWEAISRGQEATSQLPAP